MALEHYEIGERIGQGGMAEVFRASIRGGPHAGAPVAVKRLLPALAGDDAYVKLFTHEIWLASKLRHPAIVEVIESGVEAGAPFVVMEYVDGHDLARFLSLCKRRNISIPVDFGLYMAHEVAQALQCAHDVVGDDGKPLGIVHCDVSPSNVFVSRAGEVKLGDFGVARAAGEARGRDLFGKVRYLAPEQLRSGPIDARADVFGLGAVLFEILTGMPAFPGANADEVVKAIAGEKRVRPSSLRAEVSPSVDELVIRALAADPEARHPDARALAADLERAYDPRIGTALAIAAIVRAVLGA